VGFSLFPKATRFYDLLQEQHRKMAAAVALLRDLFADFAMASEACQRIADIEVEGDLIYREIRRQVSMTFLTPIDREDIQEVNLAQESVLDAARAISTRVRLCGLTLVTQTGTGLATALARMVGLAGEMLSRVLKRQDVQRLRTEVREIKQGAEALLESGLAELYATRGGEEDGLFDVIRWTQVYDCIGQAMHGVAELADALEQIGLKYA